MRFASVCSGIEAASVAWHPLGWESAWLSEIDPFPCAVLAHHYPTTPNLGDMTKISEADLERHRDIDLLVGGTPCQSFSVAGLRKGMADPRGGLALVFLELARRTRARWVVWENVPGVLSADRGRAFGSFLGGLAELGYGFAYRVLDAQYFGLAQRRKRVFVVGHLGDWRRAAAVLLERASLRGDPAPSREAGARVAGCLDGGAHGGGFDDNDARAGKCVEVVGSLCADSHPGAYSGQDAYTGRLVAHSIQDVRPMSKRQNGLGVGGDIAYTLDGTGSQGVAHSLRADGFDASEDGTGRGTPLVAAPVKAHHRWGGTGPESNYTVAFNSCFSNQGMETEMSPTLAGRAMAAGTTAGVRRLTPRECERLQGFPDDYTLIRLTKSQRRAVEAEMVAYYQRTHMEWAIEEMRHLSSDGPRYKALGNSMATTVMRHIGERIAEVEATRNAQGDDATRARGG